MFWGGVLFHFYMSKVCKSLLSSPLPYLTSLNFSSLVLVWVVLLGGSVGLFYLVVLLGGSVGFYCWVVLLGCSMG